MIRYARLALALSVAAMAVAGPGDPPASYTIDGGGWVSVGNDLSLVATIGQPDTGRSSGDTLQLDAGFWFASPAPDCPADLSGDGGVGTADLLELLADWGACGGCGADLDNDGLAGTADLLLLLASWGPC